MKTPRLELKTYEESDKDFMVEILLNEEIKETFMIPDFEKREQAENLFYKLKGFCESEDHFEYGIYKENQLIGFINDCEIEEDMIELGYVIHPKFKGNRYATEALKAAIDELFRMGFTCVRAGFFETNLASYRVMQKAGMKKIDLTDQTEYHGVVHNEIYCEICKPEK